MSPRYTTHKLKHVAESSSEYPTIDVPHLTGGENGVLGCEGPLGVEKLTPSPHTLTATDTVRDRRRIGFGVAVCWSIICGKRPYAWPGEGCRVTVPGGLVR